MRKIKRSLGAAKNERSLSLNFLENALFSITVKNKKEKRTSHHITSHHARKRNEEEKRK